jgi:DNA-binding IclR family transcriptional regulator
MQQPSLFDRPTLPMSDAVARHSDPETSHAAAESVDTAALERFVLEALRERPDGATSEELADETGLSLVTISPRLKPLEGKNLAVRDGKRKNRSGVSAIV